MTKYLNLEKCLIYEIIILILSSPTFLDCSSEVEVYFYINTIPNY